MNSAETMCDRCDGLCCRVYDIQDSTTGKIIKKAWQKCGYLDIKNKCRIYHTRSKHPWYAESCDLYDCMEWWPIVTIFSRRIPQDFLERDAIISWLLETIRLRIVGSPESRNDILQFAAELLNALVIDSSLMLSVKVVRVKIERWEK